ncbi:hypothetical protein PTSG_04101 [Salpingoeca rosetta]|uniref:TATA-binding protein interacting (TIP20) domain-containing protein n=1 Tax=Salpingoeca rosetta (strain ATCC 50818 / BSB-021) TaxID=946362 RepID=F2U6L2_SALR5|nr:uncharacterized protein PTSG_04101 [Salpingoeca rosetta]EGD83494.1 hypothetical protein PTSG_04101 [Salpingoeca rosetta]|eukprot:XP_004994998.1 hypothetical protein PTSG_04101 [Salpingoeca rosetta]
MAEALNHFLEKSQSDDKDLRFMAMNDLMAAMRAQTVNWDERATRQVLRQLLQLINDTNTEVQNLAMQCTAAVVAIANANALTDTVTTLVTQAVDTKDKERDVATTALKNIMAQISAFSPEAAMLCEAVMGPVLGSICESTSDSVTLDNLGLLVDLCTRFPKQLESQQQLIVELMLPLLSHSRTLVQKRAIAAVCALGPSLSDNVLGQTMNAIISTLESHKEGQLALTHATFVASLGREIGTRVSGYLERLVPPLLALVDVDEDDDLRDAALRSLETCARQAPKAFAPFLEAACELCIKYLSYDPNYDYGDDDEDMGDATMDEEDEDESDVDFSDDDLSDDDDVSWKVRRGAAKLLRTATVTRPDLLQHFTNAIAPVIIKQFREREENALVDMLQTYATLLSQIEVVEGASAGAVSAEDSNSLHAVLQQQLPTVVARTKPHLVSKNMLCRESALEIHHHIAALLPGAFASHFPTLAAGVKACLTDKMATANVKQQALRFLECVVKTHTATDLDDHLQDLASLVVLGVSDSFYKTVSRALGVASSFVRMLRPSPDQTPTQQQQAAMLTILEGVRAPFTSGDADLEVREKGIICVGETLARFGDVLDASAAADLLQVLMARLTNDMTRVVAVAALETICSSAVGVDVSSSAVMAVGMLTDYLRLTNASLRNNSLKALTALVTRHPTAVAESDVQRLLGELVALVAPRDMQAVALALPLVAACVNAQPGTLHTVRATLLPAVAAVVGAKNMNAACMPGVCMCLRTVVAKGVPHEEIEGLLRAQCVDPKQSKEAIRYLAKASACAAAADPALQARLFARAFDAVWHLEGNERLYHLYTLAALGVGMDVAQVKPDAFSAIQSLLATEADDFKLGVAHTLGSLAAGSPQYVETLAMAVRQEQEQQRAQGADAGEHANLYVLALKQTTHELLQTAEGRDRLGQCAGTIWPTLSALMDHDSESVRNLIAEAMSIVCLLDVPHYMAVLTEALKHADPRVRGCAVNVARFLLNKGGEENRGALRSILPPFVLAIGDDNNDVRRVALGTFKAALLRHISLVIDVLDQAMELIYGETRVRPDLIQDIQMGPFKHKVDRGADTRKAAYECLYLLLETCPERLVFSTFLSHILQGLSDDHDIQILSNLILMKACKRVPELLLSKLDEIAQVLGSVLTNAPEKKATKQEIDKLDEVKRVCISCVYALNALPGSDKSPGFTSLLSTIHNSGELFRRWEDVKREATTGAPGMDVAADL